MSDAHSLNAAGEDGARTPPLTSDDATEEPLATTGDGYPKIFSAQDKGRYALITLTLINLLNYIDRYVPSATKQYIQDDLDLTDTQTSIPLTAFVFVYMCCCPLFSWLSDQGFKRTRLIAAGIIIWSIATAAGALAFDFWTLLLSRSMVGVGEAAYATLAPALLSDFYPSSKRNVVLSCFYLAIPVGAAMGYAIGGEIGSLLGWRYAFLVAGAPGLLVAGMALAIKEPIPGAMDAPPDSSAAATHGRGRRGSLQHDVMFGLNEDGMNVGDDEDEAAIAAGEEHHTAFAVQSEIGGPAMVHPSGYHPPSAQQADSASILVRSSSADDVLDAAGPVRTVAAAEDHMVSPPWKESIIILLNNPHYVYATVGLTFVVFASGGLADWMPSWMNRVHDIQKSTASTLVGAITCAAGILGTAWGSWISERAKGVIKQPYLGVPGLNMIVTAACSWAIFIVPNVYLICVLVFFAQVAMWSYTGPINALTLNSVAPNMRVRAFAFQIMISHAFGDAISPTILGALSEAWGIRSAMLLVPGTFTLGMIVWLFGWRKLANHPAFDGGKAHDEVDHEDDATTRERSPTDGQINALLSDPLMSDSAETIGAGIDQDAINLKRVRHTQDM